MKAHSLFLCHHRCSFYRYAVGNLNYENAQAKENATNYMRGSCNQAQTFYDGDILEWRDRQRGNLVQLYIATNGDTWINNTGWLDESIDHCNWRGVTCNEVQLVTEIDLTANNLTGQLNRPDRFESEDENFLRFPATIESLLIASNSISGRFGGANTYDYRWLKYVDISENKFRGTRESIFSFFALQSTICHLT